MLKVLLLNPVQHTVQWVPASYLHVFCSLSSFGHSLVHPSYSSPHSLPSLSLYIPHQGEKSSVYPHIQHIFRSECFNMQMIVSDRQTVNDGVKLCALNEKHDQGIMTAQHSLFLWGQTSCDVYVTCTASWRGHAPEPHATIALIFHSHIKKYMLSITFMLPVCNLYLQRDLIHLQSY